MGNFIRSNTFLGLNFLELAGLIVTLHFIVIQVGIWLEYLWSDFICIQLGLLTDLRKLGQWAGECLRIFNIEFVLIANIFPLQSSQEHLMALGRPTAMRY